MLWLPILTCGGSYEYHVPKYYTLHLQPTRLKVFASGDLAQLSLSMVRIWFHGSNCHMAPGMSIWLVSHVAKLLATPSRVERVEAMFRQLIGIRLQAHCVMDIG